MTHIKIWVEKSICVNDWYWGYESPRQRAVDVIFAGTLEDFKARFGQEAFLEIQDLRAGKIQMVEVDIPKGVSDGSKET